MFTFTIAKLEKVLEQNVNLITQVVSLETDFFFKIRSGCSGPF